MCPASRVVASRKRVSVGPTFIFAAIVAVLASTGARGDTGTPLRKFVDSLAPLGCDSANNLGQCLPLALADTTTWPGADYYEIGVVQYQEAMHSDLPTAATLRGYVQLIPGTTTPMTGAHYPGPLIVATRGRPVRIKYVNLLPTGSVGVPGPGEGGNGLVDEAVGHFVTDPVERDLIRSGVLPAVEIPLVLEDKSFGPQELPWQETQRDLRRRDEGLWFWPLLSAAEPPPTCACDGLTAPVINGTAYPTLTVDPKAYRLRILNRATDRSWNLGLYLAAPTVDRIDVIAGGAGYRSPQVVITPDLIDTPAAGAAATATIDEAGTVTAISVIHPGTGYTRPPTVTLSEPGGRGEGAVADAVVGTEVALVPAVPSADWPAHWPTDGRDGGVPDPAGAGPDFIQIGGENGLLPTPPIIPSTLASVDDHRPSVTALNLSTHGLFLGPADRADVVVDFSQFAGRTLIVYNDWRAFDAFTEGGGAPATLRGYGPDTRNLMQIKVTGRPGANGTPFDLARLQAALADACAEPSPPPGAGTQEWDGRSHDEQG